MVMEDSYPVLFGEVLERVFCVDRFVRCEVLVHVNVREVSRVVHKHRRTLIPSDRGLPFCNGHEARNRGDRILPYGTLLDVLW